MVAVHILIDALLVPWQAGSDSMGVVELVIAICSHVANSQGLGAHV